MTSKETVVAATTALFAKNDLTAIDTYFGPTYTQHSALAATLEILAKQGITMKYSKRYRTLAEGNFVLTQSEGTFGGQPQAFYDLFRVHNGFIAEHWDVVAPQPTELPHTNGLF